MSILGHVMSDYGMKIDISTQNVHKTKREREDKERVEKMKVETGLVALN